MTTFPTLQPGSRAFTPGTYPNATFRTLSGRDSRVRHSNALVGMQVKAEFPLLNETELESIRSHYLGQYGGHQSFAVPDEFWSGTDAPAGFTPSGYQWRYAGKPSIEEITIDTSGTAATLFNVSIDLEAVPLSAVVLSGATFNITTTWLPGYKAVAANGATWDVTVSWAPGSSSTWGPGVDPYFANVSLLLNGDATPIVDSSSSPKTVTAFGGATINTTTKQFGSGSLEFDGSTSKYLIVTANTALDMGSGDFTIECWVRLKTMPTGEGYPSAKWIFGSGPAISAAGTQLYIGAANLHFDLTSDGSSEVNAAHGMVVGQWYHVAVTRSGNSFRGFVNGVQVGTTVTRSGSWVGGYSWGIGAAEPGTSLSANINAFIDDLRVTKDIARYTAAFTPPTAAFPTA